MAPVTLSVVPALNANDGTFVAELVVIVIEATVNVPAGSVGVTLVELIVTAVVEVGTPDGVQFDAVFQFVVVPFQVFWLYALKMGKKIAAKTIKNVFFKLTGITLYESKVIKNKAFSYLFVKKNFVKMLFFNYRENG